MAFPPSSVEDIVLKLVQGEEGGAWADRMNGWNPETNQPGTEFFCQNKSSGILARITAAILTSNQWLTYHSFITNPFLFLYQVCAWEGITCDEDGSVIAIDAAGSGLRAKIPPEYGQLKSLRSLNLAECDLYGPIPPEVFSLPNLESFDVSANAVDGTIPSAPSASMRRIVLRQNRLKGPLPDPLPADLAVLDVSKNHITGTIPLSYEQLHSMAFFDVSNNELVGSLPYHIGDLQNLQGFFVNNNRLMGTIPYSFSRDDSNLVQLFLEYNDLSGTIPAGLADIPPLKDLFVDGNKFTG